MEKKIWTAPVAQVEQFMANEYVAKCKDTENKYYAFKCDAGYVRSGWGGYSIEGDVWEGGTVANGQISNGTNLTKGKYSYYHACGATHYIPEADYASTFTSGYFNEGRYDDSTKGTFIPVIIWTDGGTDVHCTESLGERVQVVQGNKS